MFNHKLEYRPDIDGLRGIAVLAVVLFHAFPAYVPGGFVGVDVFFVISGYLITSVIYHNLKGDTFSFLDFYARRIKRIFPALILILAVSLIGGYYLLFPDEYKSLGKHAAGGSAFVSNYILLTEAGYFDDAIHKKPLMHLWSLAIEEQFYIIWPVIVGLTWRWGINKQLLIIAIILLASFFLNIAGYKQNPIQNFFQPQARFWELLTGAFLATLKHREMGNFEIHIYNKLKQRGQHLNISHIYNSTTLKNSFQFLGALTLVLGFFFFKSPGMKILIPIIGTALIIQAGPNAIFNKNILQNSILVFFGKISFPLYLWHWPLLSFLWIIESRSPNASSSVLILLLSIIMAWLTYRFIETPVRSAQNSLNLIMSLIACICILGLAGYVVNQHEGYTSRPIVKNMEKRAASLTGRNYDANRAACVNIVSEQHKGFCLINGTVTSMSNSDLYFIGDSHSEALSFGLINSPVNFISLGHYGCLPLIGVERFNEVGPHGCKFGFSSFFNSVDKVASKKATVIITSRFAAYVEGSGFEDVRAPGNLHIQAPGERIERTDTLYEEVFSRGLSDTLEKLMPSFKNVVIVLQVPELNFEPSDCISRPLKNTQFSCTIPREKVNDRQRKYREIISNVIKRYPGVMIFDPLDLFCDSSDCHVFKDGMSLYRDSNHVSLSGSKAILEALRSTGALPATIREQVSSAPGL